MPHGRRLFFIAVRDEFEKILPKVLTGEKKRCNIRDVKGSRASEVIRVSELNIQTMEWEIVADFVYLQRAGAAGAGWCDDRC